MNSGGNQFPEPGNIFGKLRVVSVYIEYDDGVPVGDVECVCACDELSWLCVEWRRLVDGDIVSCGCHQKNNKYVISERNKYERTHGSALFMMHYNYKRRCRDPGHRSYHEYGAKGVKLWIGWDEYEDFALWALNKGWKKGLYVVRINREGDFTPENCKLVPYPENARGIYFEAFGKTRNIKEWSREPECVVSYRALLSRIQNGWNVIDALTRPSLEYTRERVVTAFGKSQNLAMWAQDPICIVGEGTLRSRLYRGWNIRKALTDPLRESDGLDQGKDELD